MRKETFAFAAIIACILSVAVSYVVIAGDGSTKVMSIDEMENSLVVAQAATAPEESTTEAPEPDATSVEEPAVETDSSDSASAEAESAEVPGDDASTDSEVVVLPAGDETGMEDAITEGDDENLISIDLVEVPVNDVVKMFSSISGANIIVAGQFTNSVNASLKNVEWRSALNLILGSVDLAMIEDPSSGILMVVTSAKYQEKMQQMEATKPLETGIYTPKYLNAVDLANQVKLMNMLSPRGSIITSQSEGQSKASLKSSSLTSEIIQNPSISTSVIVTDIKEYVEKVMAMLVELDRREPQVLIEARIIDVVSQSGKKVGFDWDMLDRFGATVGLRDLKWTYSDDHNVVNSKENTHSMYDNRTMSDDINKRFDIDNKMYEETTTTYEEQPPDSGNWVSRTVTTPTRTISDTIAKGDNKSSTRSDSVTDTFQETKAATAVMSVSDLSLFLSALQTMDDIDMISHPLIVVGNRVESKIHVGERYPTVTSTRTDNTDATTVSAYSENVEWNDLGLTLWVIPEIDMETKMVRLSVNPRMSTWVKDITTDAGSVLPVISTRHLSSRVQVPSGYTVAIGGLIENRKRKIEKKVPLLGDIPFLGRLFKHTNDQLEKHNLIVLMTVTVLDDEAPSTGLEKMINEKSDVLGDLKIDANEARTRKQKLFPFRKETNAVPESVEGEASTSGVDADVESAQDKSKDTSAGEGKDKADQPPATTEAVPAEGKATAPATPGNEDDRKEEKAVEKGADGE